MTAEDAAAVAATGVGAVGAGGVVPAWMGARVVARLRLTCDTSGCAVVGVCLPWCPPPLLLPDETHVTLKLDVAGLPESVSGPVLALRAPEEVTMLIW